MAQTTGAPPSVQPSVQPRAETRTAAGTLPATGGRPAPVTLRHGGNGGNGGRGAEEADSFLHRYRSAVIAGDLVACAAAIALAVWLRFDATSSGYYKLAPLCVPVVWLGLLAVMRTYERRFLASGSQEMERVIRAGLAFFTLVAVTSYSLNQNISRMIVLLAIPLTMLGSLTWRRMLRIRVHRARWAGRGVHRTVVVGRHDGAQHLVSQLQAAAYRGLKPVAACVPAVDDLTLGDVAGVPVLGPPEQVLRVVDEVGADTVAIVSHPDLAGQELRRLSWALEERRVDLLVSPGIIEVAGPRLSIRPVAGLSLLHLEKPSAHGGKMFLKATFDRTVGTLLLAASSPVLVALGVAIRLGSRGPVFFRQTRVGVGGREFTMVKFRSMVLDAEQRLIDLRSAEERGAGNDMLFKMRADPRVTRVGAFIRRYSLDELPQLINVARGEMSLVGPRPPLPSEVATYDSDAARRLRVRPGMTGLWQVSGRSDLSWEQSLRLDLRYVDNWTLGMDLTILYKTMRAVLHGSGAY